MWNGVELRRPCARGDGGLRVRWPIGPPARNALPPNPPPWGVRASVFGAWRCERGALTNRPPRLLLLILIITTVIIIIIIVIILFILFLSSSVPPSVGPWRTSPVRAYMFSSHAQPQGDVPRGETGHIFSGGESPARGI